MTVLNYKDSTGKYFSTTNNWWTIDGLRWTYAATYLDHTFAIEKSGRLWVWGNGAGGRLGLNSTTNYASPKSIMGTNKTFCFVEAGTTYGLSIDKNGQVWSWGENAYGQLGINSTSSVLTPVSIFGNKKTFCYISAGNRNSVSIDKNGQVWCWGYNNYGQIGNNSVISERTPVSIFGNKKTFCQISSGYYTLMGIDKNGLVWGWGYNNAGQLGINSLISKSTPVMILGNTKTFCDISSGRYHTLAIDKDGLIWGWGANTYGALGDFSATNRCTPVSILGTKKTFCHIAAGYTHSVAIDKNGRLWAWGNNGNGQLGDNTYTSKRTPILIAGANKTFCQIFKSYNGTIAIDKDGNLWGWGSDTYGISSNYRGYYNTRTPNMIAPYNLKVYRLSAGVNHSTGIDYFGRVWSWGNNFTSQLGTNQVSMMRNTPVSLLGSNKTFCKISAGNLITLAIDKNGLTWAWGFNNAGVLGINSTVNKSTPVSILGNRKTFCKISVGNTSSLVIDKDGQVWGWGYNLFGGLGDNSAANKSTPVSVMGNKKTFCEISTNYYHTISIDKGGQIWAWGYNNSGQLGINSTANRSTPVSILGNKKTFCKVTSGFIHSLGVDKNGLVWGWGNNPYGQIGDNSTSNRCTPVSIHGTKKTFCKISAGFSFSIGLDKDGLIWGWGYNLYGQLGINTILSARTPVSILGNKKTFCEIFAKVYTTIAYDNYGNIWGWGLNPFGNITNNDGLIKKTPVSIYNNSKTFCKIATGFNTSLSIDKNGLVWGWGYNNQGQIGNNSTNVKYTPVSILGTLKTFCSITGGRLSSGGIDKNGLVWGWGYNDVGMLGNNSTTAVRTPVSVLGNRKTFCQISFGYYTLMGIDKNGLVWGWGNNPYGQIGDTSITNRSTPVSIWGTTKTFCQISSGYWHSAAIDKNGKVWCWGYNNLGQIGNNSTTSTRTPVSIHGTNKTFCKIAARADNNFYETALEGTMGIDYKGMVWGWGSNNYGQLGDNSVTSRRTPTLILGATKTFCQIAASFHHTLALDKDGKAWGWGYNNYGQLGNNSLVSVRTPVLITGSKTFCQIRAGYMYSMALDNNNNIWSWGFNGNGQFGTVLNPNVSTPVVIGQNKFYRVISSGFEYSMSIDNEGLIWGWGSDTKWQLGDGDTRVKSTPISILGNKKTFCKISTAELHTLGIDQYGQAWGWGYNLYGQLGINSTTQQGVPVSILGNKKTFCYISAGQNSFSFGIEYNGQVWSWGYNNVGQLGNNTLVSQLTPISILGNKKTFCKISAGYNYCLSIDKSGQVWGWGGNVGSQLGDNSHANRSTPVSILGNKKTFCQISSGWDGHSLGIDYKGQVWSWGNNGNGQLGNNSVTDKSTPVSVLGSKKTFCKISTGDKFSIGIDKSGKLWGWGYNNLGQLGINSLISKSTPVMILGNTKTFCDISSGRYHTLAIDNNNRVWTWGGNNNFAVGIPYIHPKTPILIGI